MIYVYVGCLFFGVLFSIISFLLDGNDYYLDGPNADSAHSFAILNPLVIMSSITAFGGTGIISMVGLNMSGLSSAVVSLFFAAIIGAVIFFEINRQLVKNVLKRGGKMYG